MFSQIQTYTGFRQQIHYKPRRWTRNVMSRRPRFLFIRIQQLVAIATLGVLFWLWFSASRHHESRPTYPYYDTQKPVPPWSEPAPLEGNYGREGGGK
jgi:hypothetical protein